MGPVIFYPDPSMQLKPASATPYSWMEGKKEKKRDELLTSLCQVKTQEKWWVRPILSTTYSGQAARTQKREKKKKEKKKKAAMA